MVVLQLVLDSVEWHLTVVEARHAWKRVPRDGSRTKETQRRWAACSRVVQHITDRIVQPAPIQYAARSAAPEKWLLLLNAVYRL